MIGGVKLAKNELTVGFYERYYLKFAGRGLSLRWREGEGGGTCKIYKICRENFKHCTRNTVISFGFSGFYGGGVRVFVGGRGAF